MKWFNENTENINCPCGCGATLADDVKIALDELRELYGKPIYVEQCATCVEYSVDKVGRKPTSTHIDHGAGALAVDIKHKTFGNKTDYFKFIECAIKVGFTGIGQGVGWFDIHRSDKRLHIDMRKSSDIITWLYY